jgi:TolA-binding protein
MRAQRSFQPKAVVGGGWLALMALSFSSGLAWADDVSQVTGPPPAVYKENLARLLTPADDVLKKESEYGHLEGDGIVLLDETATYVTDEGKRFIVYHSISKALNDAGVRSLAQDSFTYKKKIQKVYLVLAQTIQPDGSKDPVKNDAVFLKTPQVEADDSIYNDEITLVTVYSNVKPGSMVENITILEDTEPKIPGQFSQTYSWSGAWPEYRQRLVVDLPKTYADRLKITNLGQGVPSPATVNPSPARQQLSWEKLNTPANPKKETDAPVYQIGPLVWLSTLESWDAFAAWYSGLIQGTDTINPDLKAKIDAWTREARDPAAILRILHEHVARDVRYTGFELGKSDLQPHDCVSVWQRQYGDCKDKANLLRGMLAYKGIDSWLTLLDTEHAGTVNKANPDYRQFDHCIVTARIGDNIIFCDPTITYGIPGLLDGSDSDRDVLVVKNGRADWEHTPPFHDATAIYSFDLQLHPNGELVGWMECKATGYYAVSYQKKYRDLTKEQILSDIQGQVRSFFPNSSVADVEPLPPMPAPGAASGAGPAPFSLRAYMTLTGVLNQGDVSSELKFPAPDSLLPDISNYKTRQHAVYTWPDFNQVSARIQLPDGWVSTTLPLPLNYDSPSANFQAAWLADKNILTANCTATIKQSLFSPDEWKTFGDAITNLQSWASKSLTIAKAKDGQPAPASPQTDSDLAARLAVMPTGEGQLNLIDSEFPSDGNAAARRLALARIPVLFPSDQKSIVVAAIKVAALDLDDEKWADVISRLQAVEDANRAALDPDTIAWADYLIAGALSGQGKKDEARAAYQKIAENNSVGSWRRGWAIYRTAKFMADKSPVAALDYADKGLGLDSEAGPSLYAFYATTAITNNLADRLKDRLTKLIAAKPENLEDILLEVTDSARDLMAAGHKKEGLDLVVLLESISSPATTGDAVARAIKKVRDGAESLTTYAKLQQDLKQALIQFPDIAALEKKQPQFSSIGDAEKSTSQHEDNSETDEALGCSLRLAIGYPANENFLTYYWDCLKYAEWGMRSSPTPPKEPFFFKLTELGDELPRTSDTYVDTKLLQAKVLERKGQRSDAAAIYDVLIRQADLPDGFQGPLALRSGTNGEEQGDYAKALACYQSAEKSVETQDKAREAVLRAAFIQFDNGNKTEAFRLVNLLADAVQKGKLKASEQVGDIIALTKDGANPPLFWENWHAWWPQWLQLESYAGLEPIKDHKVIPIIPNLTDFGKSLGTAKNDKDTKQFFQLMRQMAYAARFYPNAANEFVGVFSSAEEVLPDHANDFRQLAIAMLEPLSPSNPQQQRTRILHLIVNYVDTDQSGKALDLMSRQWKPELEDSSVVTVGIHRVWGLAAIHQHQDLDKVSSALENDLKLKTGTSRVLTIGILADVYVALGRQPDAVKLIQAELADPALAADSSGQQNLKARLDNIQNVSEASKQLADGVTAWLKDHQPAWWDYVEPKNADDSRLARLDDILKNPDGELQAAELVKAGLLAPSVASLSGDTQEQAVLKAYTTLLETFGSQDDANAFAHSVLDNPSLPTSLKTSFLYSFLLDAYQNHQGTTFETFTRLLVYQSMPAANRAVMDRIASFIKVDRTSSSALTGYVQTLVRQPMDSLNLAIVQDAVANLLQMGDIESAQAIYQSAANFSFASNAGRSKPEFQLTLLKLINLARQLKPVVDALRAATLNTYKPAEIAKPGAFDQRRNLLNLTDLTEEEATKFRLYLIKIHQESLSLNFWFELMRDEKHDAANYAFKLDLLKAGFESAPDDATRATLVLFGSGVLDIDNPDLREKFLTLMQPYRDPVKYPQTLENIRLYDAEVALRTGKASDLETNLAGFTGSFNNEQANHLRLRALLQTKDLARLKSALNALSADQMMSPIVLEDTLPALEAAGMKDEAALARDTLTKKLHQDVETVWFNLNGNDLRTVRSDLMALGSTQDVPEAFTNFVKSHIARQEPLLNYQLSKAYLDGDWNSAAALGATYTQNYPDEYTAYWFFGRSLAELGRKDEAIKALAVYCQYSRDEIWYPDAKQLLAKLNGSSK